MKVFLHAEENLEKLFMDIVKKTERKCKSMKYLKSEHLKFRRTFFQ